MTTARKVKISISIDPLLLGAVDRYAAQAGVTRSAALERWLAQVSHKEKLNRLEEETAAYYEALTEPERQDDATWAAAASKSAASLRIDEQAPPKRPPSTAKRRSPRRKG